MFFREDAEYFPVKSYKGFECAPLVRRLRVNDLIEWTLEFHEGQREWKECKRRGVIAEIRRYGEHLKEMDSWDVGSFQFRVKSYDHPGTIYRLETLNGRIRLAPRPGKDF